MDTIVDFIRARLDEDEQAALEASAGGTGEWQWEAGRGYEVGSHTAGDSIPFVVCREARPAVGDDEQLAHVARHDPARVLREIDAKRLLLEEHQDTGIGFCGTCVDWLNDHLKWPCRTIRLVALSYSDHPDFREEWASPAEVARG